MERYELEVLQGMEAMLRDVRPTLICELHGPRNALVVSFLNERGYAVENLAAPGPVRTTEPTHIVAIGR